MLFIGGRALRARGLELAGKIAAKTGCKVQGAGGTARIERGAGRVPVLRLHFVIEQAQAQLKGTQQMVLVRRQGAVRLLRLSGQAVGADAGWLRDDRSCPVEGDIAGLARGAGDGTRRDEREGRGRCPAEPSGASDRQVHARRPRPGAGRDDAGRRHRGRRIGDDGPRLLPVQRRRAAARLAEQHGRLDRLRCSRRRRRRRRLPGSQGHLHDRRRLVDVHDPVAVDDGARESRRLRDDLLEPLLQHPLQPARRCRRRPIPARAPSTC